VLKLQAYSQYLLIDVFKKLKIRWFVSEIVCAKLFKII